MCCVLIQDGYTALHYAASQNCVDFVNMLLTNDPTLIEMTTKVNHVIQYLNI